VPRDVASHLQRGQHVRHVGWDACVRVERCVEQLLGSRKVELLEGNDAQRVIRLGYVKTGRVDRLAQSNHHLELFD
jgi:hypothetical protein